jgi:acetyl-CoA synthetase
MKRVSDGGYRRGAIVPLKRDVDEALKENEHVEKVIVFRRANNQITITEGRDVWWHREMDYVDANCKPVSIDSENPLYILSTSGSTGKPKGAQNSKSS